MINAIDIIIQSVLLIAATILPGITAALNLSPWFYLISGVVFLLINIAPRFVRRLPMKLEIERGGVSLLTQFLITLVPEILYGILTGAIWFGMFSNMFWLNALLIFLSELTVFWNGIIRVYLTSSMLGARWRIAGVLCGMIPIANILVLLHIMRIAREELKMESRRIEKNRDRIGKNICKTKYPILLVHGVFFRDLDKFNYWGRIPAELEKNGAKLFYGEQQSALNVEQSAREVMKKIQEVLEETGSEKVNIIAHSKGGLDSRYAISHLGADKYTASLTTVNTPHRGCGFAEWLLNVAPDTVRENVAGMYNSSFRLLGDSSPDFLGAIYDLTTSGCERINRTTPDSDQVYYQSVGSKINKVMTGVFPLNLSHMLAGVFEGDNDGLVSVESAKWGSKFTFLKSDSPDGVSHADVIDLLRHDKPDLDIREFYVQLVSELREKGF